MDVARRKSLYWLRPSQTFEVLKVEFSSFGGEWIGYFGKTWRKCWNLPFLGLTDSHDVHGGFGRRWSGHALLRGAWIWLGKRRGIVQVWRVGHARVEFGI